MVLVSISACFLEFQFLTQTDNFAWADFSLCKMADFQNGLISGIFGVFSSAFLHRTPLMGL